MKFHHTKFGFDSDDYSTPIRITELELIDSETGDYVIISFERPDTGKTHKEVYKR